MRKDLHQRVVRALDQTYAIERELGGGGMAHVFLAREMALDRPVVIKVLPPEIRVSASADRFRREMQLAARLQHPHIVPLLSAGEADGLLYYTMPFVEGESVRALLARRGGLPVDEAVRIIRDVADALDHAHRHGVVHRDIKPDNVLISGTHAVVADLGVAKALSDASSGRGLTSAGIAIGTPAYMAPEQAAGDPHTDHRADLYALGVLAYELLAGRPPFHAMPTQQLFAAHAAGVPEPLTKYHSTAPAALVALVMRLLEKNPSDRPQSAGELLRELDAVAAAPEHSTTQMMRTAGEHTTRMNRITLALIALAVLLLIGVVLSILWNGA